MREVVLSLSDGMFAELEAVAGRVHEMGFGPEQWATEAVESVLASRRLPRVTPGTLGGRVKGFVLEDPAPYPVHLPQRVID